MTKDNKETIKFLKIRDVKSPSRAYEFDAGIDFYVPKFEKDFITDLKEKNPVIFGLDTSEITTSAIYMNVDSGVRTSFSISGNGNGNEYPKHQVNYDLTDSNYTLIKYDEETGKNYFNLAPHSRIMIPAGIKSRMASPGRALIAANKSGMATNHGLVFGAQVIDYTYKGEIHLSLINTSTKLVRIYEDMKIIQFVETPVFFSKVEITNIEDKPMAEETFYKGLQDDRGSDGFDSTQIK